MIRHLLAIALVLVLVSWSPALAQESGVFQGLEWGDSIELVQNKFTITPKDSGGSLREDWIHDEQAGDDFMSRLGSMDVSSITFSFFEGRLMQIQVNLADLVSGARAHAALEARYGESTFDVLPFGAGGYWVWHDEPDTKVQMTSNMRSFALQGVSIYEDYREWTDQRVLEDAHSW